MAGNVSEWCLTDYNEHSNDPDSQEDEFVVRGSTWRNLLEELRIDFRDRYDPHYWYDYLGFRIVRHG